MKSYSQAFYADRHAKTVHSAHTILSIVLQRIPQVSSAVDLGCGVGTWLSVLQEKGVKDVQGLDGNWVDQNLLAIPRASFKQVDLANGDIRLPRRYDLAISLEVAEHLPETRARDFVASLTALSDFVLFSAAVPFQGGINHVNEQWQHYWAALFAERGYAVHDIVRARIWDDSLIPFWYRQNILLYSRHHHLPGAAEAGPAVALPAPMPLDVVHPEHYLAKARAQDGVRRSFRVFGRSVRDYMWSKLGQTH
ncbi:hypothetical protein dqs_1437 [Azoarcus olearius]|uniref:class I SAM-dependent methyltransferase n=1 Tax=Azoarcus sp. (strain BH72) TaxID=418699 RepID=UPI00080629A5|nr:class I SAM-dependent methyltransferase [Azoarcus olearius]ANQ84485.1 hypothetical protein dqs_1437 [Azoarcus olearius]